MRADIARRKAGVPGEFRPRGQLTGDLATWIETAKTLPTGKITVPIYEPGRTTDSSGYLLPPKAQDGVGTLL
jgi:hypothetical protein